jgi:hypothetical protein
MNVLPPNVTDTVPNREAFVARMAADVLQFARA